MTDSGRADVAAHCVARIDRDRLATTLTELISQPSINPFDDRPHGDRGERRVADYLGSRLERLGWACEIVEFAPGRHNVIARLPGSRAAGSGRSLMLAGHMDTVETAGYPAPFAGAVRDGRVHGRGACDMKAALACYVEVAEVLAEHAVALAGELVIAGVGDEEYRQEGAKALGKSGLRTDGVIIGEPTELTICHATKGLVAYDLTVTGEATHGSVPHHGANAILSAAELVGAFAGYQRLLERRGHPLLGQPTVNVGVIEGGVKPNIVPPECRVQFSRRLLPGETPAAVRAEVMAMLDTSVDQRRWDLSEAWWTVEPYELPDSHPLGATVRAAAEACGVADAAPHGFPASSDAAYFGSPVVLFGPGSLAQAHSLDEWVAIEDMVTATAVYLRSALMTLGMTATRRPDPGTRSPETRVSGVRQ
ncbi:M20 family metallopeptidase [Streptomyces sp. NPDC001292]|uniref:M20 family metallopeptidase n=1 Tax=Streptomyces sp. NPDC001292 TaxID=3364558 RepID=UPI003685456E